MVAGRSERPADRSLCPTPLKPARLPKRRNVRCLCRRQRSRHVIRVIASALLGRSGGAPPPTGVHTAGVVCSGTGLASRTQASHPNRRRRSPCTVTRSGQWTMVHVQGRDQQAKGTQCQIPSPTSYPPSGSLRASFKPPSTGRVGCQGRSGRRHRHHVFEGLGTCHNEDIDTATEVPAPVSVAEAVAALVVTPEYNACSIPAVIA